MMISTERMFHGFMTIKKNILIVLAGIFAISANADQCSAPKLEVDAMTAAYRLVLEKWQPADKGNARRGYNIGAILVNRAGKILAAELNAVIASQDCTQHAEMRLIQKYIARTRCFNLQGCSVYTTLEPCMMCAAVMIMAGIEYVYYGQRDIAFGYISTRAQHNTASYPRSVQCVLLQGPLQQELEQAFNKSGIREITRWLATEQARKIFVKHLQIPSDSQSGK